MARTPRQGFPSTHWSLIEAVRDPADRARQDALQRLARRYRDPAYLHIRSRGFSREDAEDLVQEFFSKALAQDLFSRADRARGRFRNLFLTSLNNFLANAQRRRYAAKRWPARGFQEVEPDCLADPDSSESVFDRVFTQQLIHQVLCDLQRECQQTGKVVHYEVFQRRVVEPTLDGAAPIPLKTLAPSLGLTEKQASNCLTTAKRAFRRLLAIRVQQYALSEDDVEQEIGAFCRHLGIKSP